LELNISYVKIEHIMNDLRKAFFTTERLEF
jgi:hypothetical protein